MKTVALYLRVSTVDQHPETQLHDLRAMAQQRGFQIVAEYTDRISGTKARRSGLDDLLGDARRGRFQVVLVWASDRIARSVRHFLEALDELNRLNVEFVSFRENLDTGGPLGRAVVIIIGAIAELERNLIIERVRAGMRRARLEGRHIGRRPIEIDRVAVLRDRNRGDSLTNIAKTHRVSRATVIAEIAQRDAVLSFFVCCHFCRCQNGLLGGRRDHTFAGALQGSGLLQISDRRGSVPTECLSYLLAVLPVPGIPPAASGFPFVHALNRCCLSCHEGHSNSIGAQLGHMQEVIPATHCKTRSLTKSHNHQCLQGFYAHRVAVYRSGRKLKNSTPNAKVGSWTLPRATTFTPYKNWGFRS